MRKVIKNTNISFFFNIKFLILILIIFFSSFQKKSYAQKQITEYELKSAYLLNFPLFVNWPTNSSITDKNKSFIITIVGKNPFKGKLKNKIIEKNKKLKDKPIVIRQVDNIKNISNPNIVFISFSKKQEIIKIVDFLNGKPILTIGDTKFYDSKGVMINMYVVNSTIKFNINIKKAKESNIYINSRLLGSASKVIK